MSQAHDRQPFAADNFFIASLEARRPGVDNLMRRPASGIRKSWKISRSSTRRFAASGTFHAAQAFSQRWEVFLAHGKPRERALGPARRICRRFLGYKDRAAEGEW